MASSMWENNLMMATETMGLDCLWENGLNEQNNHLSFSSQIGG